MKSIKIFLLVFILSVSISAQWYQQNSGTTNNFYYVQFVNELVGWSIASSTTNQLIYNSMDGGQNWELLLNSQYPIFQIFFTDENIGWMKTWTTGSTLLKSVDGGENWLPVYSYLGATDYIKDFEFINPDTGWFVGEQTISIYENGINDFPVIFKETTDGGMTWVDKNFTSIPLGGLNDIDAIDYLNLIVAGLDTLYKTTNGGIDWQKHPLPQNGNFIIQFINMNIGWVSTGGKLFKTTDGGEYWYQQVQQVNNFYFITSQIGWYTYNNQIYNSTNGGNTWILQNSNTTNTLGDIFFLNNNLGWAVGADGTILNTNNGGTPVEIISFIADYVKGENTIELTWTTATETNNSGFEIQSTSPLPSPYQGEGGEAGRGWETISFVPGHGTTTEPQFYSFTDESLPAGQYQYRLKQIDFDGSYEYSKIVEVRIEAPQEFSLSQNYPNPFNPSTKIRFVIPNEVRNLKDFSSQATRNDNSLVILKVYDVLGNEVAILVNEEKPAGEYEVEFNGTNLPSGIYFYQLKAGNFIKTQKMVLMK